MNRLLLHAPNVNTGGGLVLLKDLLSVPDMPLAWLSVDARAVDRVRIPIGTKTRVVRRSALDRFAVEFDLRTEARAGDVVLCFHGMPPLLRSVARVVVFHQNRNNLGVNALADFSGWTMFRIAFERLFCRLFKRNVDEFFVQTPSMARLVSSWHGGKPSIRVIPFLDLSVVVPASNPVLQFDFVYVADGVAHKNHAALLEAWVLLAAEGLRPSLALTLGKQYQRLIAMLEQRRTEHHLKIENLGEMDRGSILELYSRSRALVYPSTSESFAIPLIEAAAMGLPIVAAELDYVRDVASPAQTFDPTSPTSIARAVKRFLGIGEPIMTVSAPDRFFESLRHGPF